MAAPYSGKTDSAFSAGDRHRTSLRLESLRHVRSWSEPT